MIVYVDDGTGKNSTTHCMRSSRYNTKIKAVNEKTPKTRGAFTLVVARNRLDSVVVGVPLGTATVTTIILRARHRGKERCRRGVLPARFTRRGIQRTLLSRTAAMQLGIGTCRPSRGKRVRGRGWGGGRCRRCIKRRGGRRCLSTRNGLDRSQCGRGWRGARRRRCIRRNGERRCLSTLNGLDRSSTAQGQSSLCEVQGGLLRGASPVGLSTRPGSTSPAAPTPSSRPPPAWSFPGHRATAVKGDSPPQRRGPHVRAPPRQSVPQR